MYLSTNSYMGCRQRRSSACFCRSSKWSTVEVRSDSNSWSILAPTANLALSRRFPRTSPIILRRVVHSFRRTRRLFQMSSMIALFSVYMRWCSCDSLDNRQISSRSLHLSARRAITSLMQPRLLEMTVIESVWATGTICRSYRWL